MNLHLDTSNNLQTIIKIGQNTHTTNYSSPRDQHVLTALDKALKQEGVKLSDLTSITINTGPGSFTGLRVGCAIANTLALTLNLPINGGAKGQSVFPLYSKPPSITLSPKIKPSPRPSSGT